MKTYTIETIYGSDRAVAVELSRGGKNAATWILEKPADEDMRVTDAKEFAKELGATHVVINGARQRVAA